MSYYLSHQTHSAKQLPSSTFYPKAYPKLHDQKGQGNYYINIHKQKHDKPKYNNYQVNYFVPESLSNHKYQPMKQYTSHLKFDKHDYHISTPYSDQHSNKHNNYLGSDFKKIKAQKDLMSTSMQYYPSHSARSNQQCNQQNRQLQFFDDIKKEKQRKGSFFVNKKSRGSQLPLDSRMNDILPKMKRSYMDEKSPRLGSEKKHDNKNDKYKKQVQNWKKQDALIYSQPTNSHPNVKTVTTFNVSAKRKDYFVVLKKLGEGSFGQVFQVIHSHTNTIYALKAISKKYLKSKEHSQTTIFRQIKIQLYLDHPNIVKLYHVFSDFQYIYLLMEYMDGNLYDRLQRKNLLPLDQAAGNVYALMKAVNCLHKQKIIHRDLKLQNIMLCNKIIKLGDFGCAIHTFDLRSTKIGSFAYHSPQQLKENLYNQKVDVWGLGIITYQLLFGKTPYDDDIIKILQNGSQAHELSDLVFPQNIKIPPEARDFILKMLEKDHRKRINLAQAMKHQFIIKNVEQQDFE